MLAPEEVALNQKFRAKLNVSGEVPGPILTLPLTQFSELKTIKFATSADVQTLQKSLSFLACFASWYAA